MNPPEPHFLLLADVSRRNQRDEWSFVLHAADGTAMQTAQELEPDQHGERLELLSVIRGLEALDQPSRVTLVTRSKYVRRGIAYGLDEWRANDWTWECYGEMVPVKNRDLWQRLDRAMAFHQIELRTSRVDTAHVEPASDLATPARGAEAAPKLQVRAPHFLRRQGKNLPAETALVVESPAAQAEPFELVEVECRGDSRPPTAERHGQWLSAWLPQHGLELINWTRVKVEQLIGWLNADPWPHSAHCGGSWLERNGASRSN
ncbi:MAG: hypothetical protein JSS27_17410 [Planctomycetes bacterium]|nr:hypothetical protein [Planctomycetota bacterium]